MFSWFQSKKTSTVTPPPNEGAPVKTAPVKTVNGGWGQKMGGALANLFGTHTTVDTYFFDELEDTLLLADVGVSTATRWVDGLKNQSWKSTSAVQEALAQSIEAQLLALQKPITFDPAKLSLVMVTGVNGAGKTTFIGKLAHRLKNEGHRVVIGAGDTFRAAAVEQLAVWATRAEATLVSKPNGDPAAVAYEAIDVAKHSNASVIILDTAGRLQNQINLMNELKKIDGVIAKQLPVGSQRVNWLVLDATTGQNGLQQASVFTQSLPLHGIVLTKLDGTAKGGVVLSIADELKLPVQWVGVGESIEDLIPFEPKAFARSLCGLRDS
ncbi:MAG: signal recognition particle-docking protein FtsY [Vampirovibrionales bacterium]|nr:signal recognition particle-docking protein FtsY [Vampirovibrionales bacterium]